MKIYIGFLFLLLIYLPVFAQHEQHERHQEHPEEEPEEHAEYDHAQRGQRTDGEILMPHSFSLNLPMNRNGSGTGWLPDASPMYGYMMHTDNWMYMIHRSDLFKI
ncbi:hypothetical protein BH23BAC1_BH23BAC1_42370 [soil metagenome]